MRGNRNNLVVGTILLYLCLLWDPCPAAVIATDPAGDAGSPTIPNLDLLQLDAAVQDGYLIITLTINGDVGATDWGKYIVSIDTDQVAGSGGMSQFPDADPPTNDANPWTRNIAIANQQHLAEYFIGSWVDGDTGVQLWRFTGTGSPQWQMSGGMGMAVSPGPVSTITYTILLSDLGVWYPATLCMEAYSSGSYSYDTANDTVNNPSDDWVWDGQNWQAQASVQNSSCFPLPGPKWSQPPHGPEEGFDAASDLWWNEIKWEQEPNPALSGLHCHDWYFEGYAWTTIADDWYCEGGAVTDLHWWGCYEFIGSGIDHFHLSIHATTMGPQGYNVPQEPPLWQMDAPFTAVHETDTGMVGAFGPIYAYHFDLPDPFQQQPGNWYWFDLSARSVDPMNPNGWHWQEANRGSSFLGHAPAASSNTGGPWDTIWGGETFSDMAFVITSRDLLASTQPNKVVADDFVSDGRTIEGVRWWGSYLDDLYEPAPPRSDLYAIDGWFISFHHDQVLNPGCPPDFLLGDPHPTVLGVYFAPLDAVQTRPLTWLDCLGHQVYEYVVDLSQCCLLCSQVDPRPQAYPPDPARQGEFLETRGLYYWLDIQAVTGVTWQPQACSYGDRILTGHLPSPYTTDGHFWGWHTSPGPATPCGPRYSACTGRIADLSAYPPDCWDYGGWGVTDWLCPSPPPSQGVQMAFDLLSDAPDPCPTCPGDLNGDYVVNGADIQCFVHCFIDGWAALPCNCACADFDCSKTVDLGDVPYFVTELLATTICPGATPLLGEVTRSNCLPGSRGGRGMCEADEITFAVQGRTLHTDHDQAEYNCCLDDITVSLTVQGNVIRLDEEEVLTLPCYCTCCYDVQAIVVNLTPGTYIVQYCWFDYGFGQRCHEEEVVIP